MVRIGNVYDVHQLAENRDFVLGGVKIPHDKGLLGHSDADVLVHAIMDALLGAAALGISVSISPIRTISIRGISSLKLLGYVKELLFTYSYEVGNIDSIIVAQRPKLAPFIDQMRKNIADTLMIPQSRVSVKATTTEKLGFAGRMEGIESYSVCLIQKVEC